MNKSKTIVIGITGQTGAGKSTVTSIVKKHFAAYVIDADKISRKVIDNNNIKKKLIQQFGSKIISNDGTIIRNSLADIAFSSTENTKKLNNIMLKEIAKEIKFEIDILKNKNKRIILIDAPLLFESGLNEICNVTISVVAQKETRLKRIINRDNLSIDQAQKRINIQNNEEFFKRMSDYILDGNKKKSDLYNDIINLITNILEVVV